VLIINLHALIKVIFILSFIILTIIINIFNHFLQLFLIVILHNIDLVYKILYEKLIIFFMLINLQSFNKYINFFIFFYNNFFIIN
jgi:hypothetical protein